MPFPRRRPLRKSTPAICRRGSSILPNYSPSTNRVRLSLLYAEQPWWADLECAPEGEEDILEEDLLNEDAWVVPGDESPEFNAMQHGAAYPSFAPASWGQPSMHPQAAYAHQAAAPYAQGHPPYMPGPSPHAPLFPRPPPGNPPPASSGVPPPQPPPFPPAGPPPAEPRLSGAVSGARFAEFRPGVGVVAAGGASEAQGGGGAGKEGEGDEVDWNDYYQGDPEADDNAEEAYAEDFLEEDDWFTGEDGDGEGGQQVEVSTEVRLARRRCVAFFSLVPPSLHPSICTPASSRRPSATSRPCFQPTPQSPWLRSSTSRGETCPRPAVS